MNEIGDINANPLNQCGEVCSSVGCQHVHGCPAGAMNTSHHIRVSQGKRAAVNTELVWIAIADIPPPMGVKLQLINRHCGVATYGSWNGKDKFWTHWQGLPKFDEAK